jgi:glycosyltransferase involved in cell wall biosynthesis
MKIAAIIPAYNEEKTVRKIIREVQEYVDTVIVVNDGSTDNTEEIAQKAGARVISHDMNRGVGAAVRTGIDAALRLGADILVSIDADGQFDPEDTARLVEPILKGEADFVPGSRFSNCEYNSDIPKLKKMGNSLFTKIVNVLIRSNFTDTQCGFRALSREAALRINLFGDFTYTQETFLDLASKKMRIKEIPVKVTYDRKRKSRVVKNPFYYSLNALLIIIRTMIDLYPLKFFGTLGSLIFSSGAVMGSVLFIRWAMVGKVSPYASMVTLSGVLLIVGFLCIIMALIADMLGRQKRIQEEILYYAKLEALEKSSER